MFKFPNLSPSQDRVEDDEKLEAGMGKGSQRRRVRRRGAGRTGRWGGTWWVTKPYKFIGFGAMEVTKLYKFIGFGAMEVTKPYKFIGCGAMEATRSSCSSTDAA